MADLAAEVRGGGSAVTDVLDGLAAIVGDRHVLTDADSTAPFLVEERGLYRGRARAVVRPGAAAEVAAVLGFCNAHRIAVVPQGGNTGLVGGQIPSNAGDEVILSLRRMDKVRDIDPAANALTIEAGATLLAAQEAATGVDRLFPLSLASEGSATIGGNLSTNAGGTAAIAYGTARDLVLGIEVALPDGRLLSNLGKLKKDNTGYDLKHLFMGSEGTLGIITAAVLKLFPKPRATATAFIGLPSPQAALDLLLLSQDRVGADLKTFELIPRIGIDFVLRHGSAVRDPLGSRHAWYVLLELTSQTEGTLDATLEGLLEAAIEDGLVEDAALATSGEQRKMFWRLRELMSEMQKYEGGSIKHDVSVPIGAVPAFLTDVEAAIARTVPGARPVLFGHLGDGNIHANVSQPEGMDKQAFLDRWDEVNTVVHDLTARCGGSISAEHGIGIMKRGLLPGVKDPVALALMHEIKRALDPHAILNPGKVL